MALNKKQQKTLSKLFEQPVRSDISWKDIESLLLALGAEISEGRGSRVRVALNGVRAVFHRPHPQPQTDKGAVGSMRRFLTEAGVKADEI
ncbi:probable HicA protein [Crocosphaera subtropica ATCC 51142]|uniref:Probable HicA protein n=1 Tax=Crocosphaera subtropica (strain ATCC 51142 / BH68) TaxID=43989 RepID=B1X2M3_CROS5|nr:type II toxin-antitoxin system HicA family toxin [Crocosphaera subtropica]ACB54384.1 probable HicA protein [Crocosphaera subtropica ATCC 51142]